METGGQAGAEHGVQRKSEAAERYEKEYWENLSRVTGALHLGSFEAVQRALDTERFVTITAVAPRQGRPGTETRIRLPPGADVALLRHVMMPVLPSEVSVLERRDGESEAVLAETDIVRGPLVFLGLRGRLLPFYARFTRKENCAAQRFVRAFFMTAEGQARLDELERATLGDELRYSALLSDFLGREVYPSMLKQFFGIPFPSRALQIGIHCMNWSHLDFDTARLWFEAEWVMRNRKKAAESRDYLAYYESVGAPPAPRWAAVPAEVAAAAAKGQRRVAAPYAEIQLEPPTADEGTQGPASEVITLRLPHMTLKGLSYHFAEKGWAVVPQLGMPYEVLEGARAEAEALEPAMHPGRQTNDLYSNPGFLLRSDRIIWIYDGMLRDLPCVRSLALSVVGFVKHVAESFDITITGQEAPMLASYDAGSFFRRHFDRTTGRSVDRVLTAVYYLNRDWDASKGGALRVCPGKAHTADILPHEDSLVLFLAETVEHEVRTSQAKRRALTIWFKGARNN